MRGSASDFFWGGVWHKGNHSVSKPCPHCAALAHDRVRDRGQDTARLAKLEFNLQGWPGCSATAQGRPGRFAGARCFGGYGTGDAAAATV